MVKVIVVCVCRGKWGCELNTTVYRCGGICMCMQYLSHLDAFPVEPDIPVSELVYEPHKPGYNGVQRVHYEGDIYIQWNLS